MFRKRKSLDPEVAAALDRFEAVAGALDRAQRALLGAIPTSRHPGAPLSESLDAFDAGVEEVSLLMPQWRLPAIEELWQACRASLDESRRASAQLRRDPPGPTEFEALNARVGDVLAPLEDFAEAERALRRRR